MTTGDDIDRPTSSPSDHAQPEGSAKGERMPARRRLARCARAILVGVLAATAAGCLGGGPEPSDDGGVDWGIYSSNLRTVIDVAATRGDCDAIHAELGASSVMTPDGEVRERRAVDDALIRYIEDQLARTGCDLRSDAPDAPPHMVGVDEPRRFVLDLVEELAAGRYGAVWDALHPRQQASLERTAYEACTADRFIDGEIIAIDFAGGRPETAVIGSDHAPSRLVTVRITTGAGATSYLTLEAAEFEGELWVADTAAYPNGNCP
jgi:hypothetical protein